MYKMRFWEAVIFLRTLTISKICNSSLLRISYLLSTISNRVIHAGQPESLSIEPTNICNLYCPECPSGNNIMNRHRLFMSFENFKSIIDNSYKKLVYLQLFFQGEPFLNPKIFDFISYATKRNIYTCISTNGHFLTKDNCLRIINSGLKKIIISVDGATQNVYEKYRVGGSLDTVFRGIRFLVNTKKELKMKSPHIVFQFVVTAHNEHQIPLIVNLAKKLNVDELQLKTAQIGDFKSGNEMLPINERYSRYKQVATNKYELNRNTKFKCRRIWNGVVITADNQIVPCCFDKNANHNYGSLSANNLQSLWRGKKASQFRRQVWKNYSQFEICQNCTEGIKKHRILPGV